MKIVRDSRGPLIAIDLEECPFKPVRVFTRSYIPYGECVGNHYHKTLKEFIIVTGGACFVTLSNRDPSKPEPFDSHRAFRLKEGEILYLEPYTKLELYSIEPYTSIMVLCSEPYDSKDVYND